MLWCLPSRSSNSPSVFQHNADSRGFTLIEVISVLVLLGILAAVVVNRSFDNSADVIGEVEVVKGHLRFAQMKAMNSDTPWGISFTGNSYTMLQNGLPSATPLPGQNSATYTLAKGAVSATRNPIVFNQWGDPGVALTVTVTVGANSQAFQVAQTTGFMP